MASLVIAAVVCGRSLYKSHQQRRLEKRKREIYGDVPPKKKDKPQRASRRSRLLNRSHNDSNSSNNSPQTDANMHAAPTAVAAGASTASFAAEPRRRMSDESTLAELRTDGDWTRRTR